MSDRLTEIFVNQVPVWELVLRGSVVYLALLGALRILVRRHVGSMSISDLLLLVLIADAAQNAMAGAYMTVGDGLVLCGTLFAWNYLLDWLAFQFTWVARLLEPPPLLIVEDGRALIRNMRKELITMDELVSHLKMQGVQELSEVRRAYVEPDGGISVVRADGGRIEPTGDSRPRSF